jgi:hypothetical protein
MLQVPVNQFNLIVKTQLTGEDRLGPRHGVSVTPGNNAYGTWVTLITGSALVSDAYAISININHVGLAGTITNQLVSIGIDTAGGSNYTDIIPDLLCAGAAPYTTGGGISYHFPLFIPSGTTLGVRSSRDGTAGLIPHGVHAVLYCSPTNPEIIRAGSYVEAFGVNRSASAGTNCTMGTAGFGPYVKLTGNISRNYWWWQCGYGANDNSQTAQGVQVDIAVSTGAVSNAVNNSGVVCSQHFNVSATEQIWNVNTSFYNTKYSETGNSVYGRARTSAAAGDSLTSIATYGLGG